MNVSALLRLVRVHTAPLFQHFQVADFSKFIPKARAKRLPLTTKRAGKGYYKGNRTRKEGFLTSKGWRLPNNSITYSITYSKIQKLI